MPATTTLSRFPLGKTGGLIEASGRACGLPATVHGFRWVKPAASLKRYLGDWTLTYMYGFRWVKPAASLKPGAPRHSER